jgi:hypothetical protein
LKYSGPTILDFHQIARRSFYPPMRAPIDDYMMYSLNYHSLFPSLPTPSMSINPSPELKSLFEAALEEFEKRAGTNLLQHQVIDKLVNCQSADSVIDVLQQEAQAFRDFRGDDGRLMTWLKRTVNVLYVLSTSSVLGEGIGLVRLFLRPASMHRVIPSFRGNGHPSWRRCPI